jgi:hypothetical protein
MDLPRWLLKVAAAVNFEVKPLTAEVYLEELVKWRLTDDQWEELRSHVKLRLPWFPKIPELSATAEEILQEADAKESARRAIEKPADAIECPPEVRAQMRKLTLMK